MAWGIRIYLPQKRKARIGSEIIFFRIWRFYALAQVIGFLILCWLEDDLAGDLVLFNDAVGFRRVA